MPIVDVVALFVAAFLAGALNSVAGGGSFISFPTLLFAGVPAVSANATSTIALWPGSVASAGAYRSLLGGINGLRLMIVVSLIGGFLGAELLVRTPSATFLHLVPYLLLLATLLFAFGGRVAARLRRVVGKVEATSAPMIVGIVVIQLIIATYGGFFGGGIGILMLAALALAGMDNIHEMNALKTVLAACINGVAVVTFILAGVVSWPPAILMAIAAILGGYGGAFYASRLDPQLVRRFVLVVAIGMTIYFFVRG